MMTVNYIGRRGQQTGQALTEFLVVALAIVPLFLLIPMIAKYQDIGYATQMASRYAAFDATINNPSTTGMKDPAILAQEVRRRFFSNIDAPIKTNDAAGNFRAHQNAFWRGPNNEPLIQDINTVAVNLATAGSGGLGMDILNTAGRGITGLAGFGLPSSPLYQSNVGVPLVNLPAGIRSYEPFDQLNLRVERNTTVLVNGWSARSVDQARERTERSLPVTQALGVFAGVSTFAIGLLERGEIEGPRIGQLDRYQDIVPADRLRAN
jgi:hypothetical protein